jgi:hypothetical protein
MHGFANVRMFECEKICRHQQFYHRNQYYQPSLNVKWNKMGLFQRTEVSPSNVVGMCGRILGSSANFNHISYFGPEN